MLSRSLGFRVDLGTLFCGGPHWVKGLGLTLLVNKPNKMRHGHLGMSSVILSRAGKETGLQASRNESTSLRVEAAEACCKLGTVARKTTQEQRDWLGSKTTCWPTLLAGPSDEVSAVGAQLEPYAKNLTPSASQ